MAIFILAQTRFPSSKVHFTENLQMKTKKETCFILYKFLAKNVSCGCDVLHFNLSRDPGLLLRTNKPPNMSP